MYNAPPGQGHYPAFDPPPASAYDDYDSPRGIYEDNRPYAPSDPRAHSFNQMTPYDDDKAEAGWARSWEEQRAYTHRPPPPPSDYDLGRKPRPTAGDRYYDDRYDDRYNDDSYYDRERDSHARRRRRRSAEDSLKNKALGYPADPKKGGRDALGGSEGERGIAAKLIGGAGGALLGQTFGRGHTLETIAGATVGAIAANAIEKQIEKRREEKVYVRHGRDGYAATPAGPFPQPGRDMRDVRETGRDGARPSLRERIRSLSRRGARSLSRRRLSGDRQRRSDSYDSIDSLRRESSR